MHCITTSSSIEFFKFKVHHLSFRGVFSRRVFNVEFFFKIEFGSVRDK